VIGFVFEYFTNPLLHYSNEILGTVDNWSTILIGLSICFATLIISLKITDKIKGEE